jgi:6-phospho-beta-glucosidase
MRALARDRPARLILNVRNGAGGPGAPLVLPSLPADAVVETVCEVDGSGVRPVVSPVPLGPAELGLVLQLKAVERATIEAALFKDREAALRAVALHPLVDSVAAAERVLARAGA